MSDEETVPLVTKYRKDKAELRELRGTTEKDPTEAIGISDVVEGDSPGITSTVGDLDELAEEEVKEE